MRPDLEHLHTETRVDVLRAYVEQSTHLHLDQIIETLAVLRVVLRICPEAVDDEVATRLRWPTALTSRETEGLAGKPAGASIPPAGGSAAPVEPSALVETQPSTSRVPPAGGGRPEDNRPTAAPFTALEGP